MLDLFVNTVHLVLKPTIKLAVAADLTLQPENELTDSYSEKAIRHLDSFTHATVQMLQAIQRLHLQCLESHVDFSSLLQKALSLRVCFNRLIHLRGVGNAQLVVHETALLLLTQR